MSDHDTTQEGIAGRIAYLIDASGIGVKLLSTVCGLSGTHLGQIKHAKVCPTADTLEQICRTCGCSMDWLWRGIGSAPRVKAVRASVDRAREATEKTTAAGAT